MHYSERSKQHLDRLVHHYAPPFTALLYCSLAPTSAHPHSQSREGCTHYSERSNQHLDRLVHHHVPPSTPLLYCSLDSTDTDRHHSVHIRARRWDESSKSTMESKQNAHQTHHRHIGAKLLLTQSAVTTLYDPMLF